jgi:predicted dehydrogenase
MSEPLKVGIIGCGRIGALLEEDLLREKPASHLGALKALPELFSVEAVCDVNLARVTAVAEKWNVKGWYLSVEEMLEEKRLDVVSVCTPPETHAEVVWKVVRHRKRPALVFVEKPISTDLHSADSMVEYCRKYGVKLMVNHTRRWCPAFRHVKALLDSGEIGELEAFHGVFSGDIVNDGVHMADLVCWFKPKKTSILNVKTPYLLFEVDLVGSNGRIKILNNGEKFEVYKPAESQRYQGVWELVPKKVLDVKFSFSKAIINAYKEIYECVKENMEPSVGGREGIEALRTCLKWRGK